MNTEALHCVATIAAKQAWYEKTGGGENQVAALAIAVCNQYHRRLVRSDLTACGLPRNTARLPLVC